MFYKSIIRPQLFRKDAEASHDWALNLLERASNNPSLLRLIRFIYGFEDEELALTLFGLDFPNPIGLAAGFSKFGLGIGALEALGFGSLELGGVTPEAQPGNPTPRMFRLEPDSALINRMGFNNPGAIRLAEKLGTLPTRPQIPIGINLGKGKATPIENAVGDYVFSLQQLFHAGDYFVANVSSPNTPNLRNLQDRVCLAEILGTLVAESKRLGLRNGTGQRPVLVKIAPDLSDRAIVEAVEAVEETGARGIIACNTTIRRDNLRSGPHLTSETGGLSGAPLLDRCLEVVELIHDISPKLPIIASGGIMSGRDAFNAILAGASHVQIYTALPYEGPGIVKKMKQELLRCMHERGRYTITAVRDQLTKAL